MINVADILQLSPEQAAAVSTEHRRTLVEAAAGAGKTRVIIGRILALLDAGARPCSVVCFTFTRSACEEIRQRLLQVIGPTANDVIVTTFHAWCAFVAVPHTYRVATEAEADAALRSLSEGAMRRPARGLLGPKQIQKALVKHESGKGDVWADEQACIDIIRARLACASLVPMWDLIPEALRMVDSASLLASHVLVDEAHDITNNELKLVERIAAGGSTFFVWDPRQAIMGWRGAGANLAVDHVFQLSRSFRFGPAIADVANRLNLGPIEGDLSTASTVEAIPDDLQWGSALMAALEEGASRVLVLARTNLHCDAIARLTAGRAVHVRRDPTGDPLSAEADRFANVWASGRGVVSTIHAAKGREADVVFLAPDECFPRPEPEEFRVFYVAVTRARKRLVLGFHRGCEVRES